jgi:hypothetical protein
MRQLDDDGWVFSEQWVLRKQGRIVEWRQRFELTEDEIKWLQACADACGGSLQAELERRVVCEHGDAWLENFSNEHCRAAQVMDAALAAFAAQPPAPRPFRVYDDVALGYNGRVPADEDEWRLAADRWRRHLTAEGAGLFDLALAAALALDGVGAAKWVELASRHVLPDHLLREDVVETTGVVE